MKKQAVVDTSGNIIECFTVSQASRYLNITSTQLRLQLYRTRAIPYYKVFTKKGSKVVRIKRKDLDDFVVDNGLFDRIAERIVIARNEHVRLVTGISQVQLSRDIKISREQMNRIERKKERVGLKTLKRISEVLEKPIEYFVD